MLLSIYIAVNIFSGIKLRGKDKGKPLGGAKKWSPIPGSEQTSYVHHNRTALTFYREDRDLQRPRYGVYFDNESTLYTSMDFLLKLKLITCMFQF